MRFTKVTLVMVLVCLPGGCFLFDAPEASLLQDAIVPELQKGILEGDESFSHTIYSELLTKYVIPDEERVNYSGLKQDEGILDQYLKHIANANLERLARDEQMALLINAYNAYTLKLILEHYPGLTSIRNIRAPWSTKRYKVGRHSLSLDDIEHGLLRPLYKDPRVHFALNCASIGCPTLQPWAYNGTDVDHQLDLITKQFVQNARHVKLDGNTLFLSSILNWYNDDFINPTFQGSANTLPEYIATYADLPLKQLIMKHGENLTVKFLDYDWGLNDK